MKKTYRVIFKKLTYAYLDVEAESASEVRGMSDDLFGEEWEFDEFWYPSSEWEIDEVVLRGEKWE